MGRPEGGLPWGHAMPCSVILAFASGGFAQMGTWVP